MKKLFILVASMFLFLSVSHAEDVVITTGGKGLTYNGVYGPNLASALQEYGNSVTVNTSKGSLDNLDKVASGQAQIGFTQADAYMFWRTNHPNEAQNIDIIGELGQECVFVAVRDDTVDVPCTKTLVIGNVNASDELLDSVAGIMLKNRSRVLGEADK